MKRYAPSWTLPPTERQVAAIERLYTELGSVIPTNKRPTNRWEARRLLFELKQRREGQNGSHS